MGYTRTTWANGNLVTPALLNNIETGIDGIAPTGVAATDTANIQAAINLGGLVKLGPGVFVINSGLTVAPGAFVAIRGAGKGVAGGFVGTRLERTSGTTPILSVTGTGQLSSQRAICEISDMELKGNNSAGDVLAVARANHLDLYNVRVTNNVGGIGVHLTEVWDSTIENLWVEGCGSGTTSPAMLMDSQAGAGATGDCATIQMSNITFQSNYGTDWKLSGSTGDVSPCNDIEAVNVKMEGTGAGTSGTPDTYPYIDLDYAQNCQFTNVRISMPTGRASVFIQQATSGASSARANKFHNTLCDVAGSNSPVRFIDHSAGGLFFNGLSLIGSPTTEYFRIGGSVGAGRFRVLGLSHNSPNVSTGFITDPRSATEELNKGRLPIPIMSSDGTLTTIGDNAVWALADAADQYVRGQVVLPRDIDATGKAYIRVYWTASTTGNVAWSWWQSAVSAGGNLSTAGTQSDQTIASPGANLLAITSWGGSGGISASAGQLVTVRLGRKGTAGGDTMTGTAYVVAIELYYDKRI